MANYSKKVTTTISPIRRAYVFLWKYKEFDDLFLCKDGQHPILVEMYTCSEISRETLIGFDSIFSCFKKWNAQIEDPIVWPDIFQQCERYRPFLNIEQERFKTVLKEGFIT